MRVLQITRSDVERLLSYIDRDPAYGRTGGSSSTVSEHERRVYDDAHRFFNYQVRRWLEEIDREV